MSEQWQSHNGIFLVLGSIGQDLGYCCFHGACCGATSGRIFTKADNQGGVKAPRAQSNPTSLCIQGHRLSTVQPSQREVI